MRTIWIASALLWIVAPLAAQPPAGLGASALTRPDFTWSMDSVPGVRAYFLRGTYADIHRDSLLRRLPDAVAHARAMIAAPAAPGPIDVFFVERREQMQALTGANATGFAHTSARAVFLVTNPDWRAFERHEIMHVVSVQAWGRDGMSKAWLLEGLAQAADGSCGGHTNEAIAIALASRSGWIDLATLVHRFREQSDLRAYLQAAAFTDYLLRNAGVEPLRELWVAEADTSTRVRGRTLADWEREWRGTLARSSGVPASTIERVELKGCG
jgi:hypothetical protein